MLHQPASTFEPSQPASSPPDPKDAAIASATRGWEGEINDLADLSDVLADVAENNLRSNDDTVILSGSQVRRLLFCAYELASRIEQFKGAYYAATTGDPVGVTRHATRHVAA